MCNGILEDLYDKVADLQNQISQNQNKKTIIIDAESGEEMAKLIRSIAGDIHSIKCGMDDVQRDMIGLIRQYDSLRYIPICDEDSHKAGFARGFYVAVRDMVDMFSSTYSMYEENECSDADALEAFIKNYKSLLEFKKQSNPDDKAGETNDN